MQSMTHANASRKKRGFTLIELAMVFAIFGFVVAGTLAGVNLIRDSKLQNTAKELAQLRRAVMIYQERYNSFPGDTPDASGLFGCTGCNGNGNGHIDMVSESAPQALLEQKLFWEHLSRAGLIKYSLRASNRTIGTLYPPSAAADGAAITIEGRLPDRAVAMVHFIQIASDGSVTEPSGVGPLKPEEAERIDRMIDDGSPINGLLIGEAGNGLAVDICRDAAGGYAALTASGAPVGKKCNLGFILAGRAFQNAKSKVLECQWSVKPLASGSAPGTEWRINAINGSAGDPFTNSSPDDQGYSACSQSCGDGFRSRSVSCGNDTVAGTLNLSVTCNNVTNGTTCGASDCLGVAPANTRPFTGCTTPPPPSQKACNMGTCAHAWVTGSWGSCKDASGTAIPSGDWELSNWGECNAQCGTGSQNRTATCRSRLGTKTRSVTCSSAPCDNSTKPVDTDSCVVSDCGTAPTLTQACNPQPCNGWVAGSWGACSPSPSWAGGSWSACNSACGSGLQTRTVTCDSTGSVQTRTVYCPSGSTCSPADKPATSQACSTGCLGARPSEVQSCMGGGASWGDIFNSSSHIYRSTADSTGWIGCIGN